MPRRLPAPAWSLAVMAIALAWLAAAPAQAYTFRPYSTLLSVEGGATYNFQRLDVGTRQTPESGATAGVTAELNVLHSPWHPHRLSLVVGLLPTFQVNWHTIPTGVRPGLSNPFPNPGIWSYPALGTAAVAGIRYRWETGFSVTPFLEATGQAAFHKVLKPGPIHLNLAVRLGGGVEYWLLHQVALFAAFHVRGGLLLWPLPYQVPWPEGSAEGLTGVRIRLF